MHQQLPGYHTPKEIAQELGFTPQFVLNAITGRWGKEKVTLKGYKVNNTWLVPEKDAIAFVKHHKTKK